MGIIFIIKTIFNVREVLINHKKHTVSLIGFLPAMALCENITVSLYPLQEKKELIKIFIFPHGESNIHDIKLLNKTCKK